MKQNRVARLDAIGLADQILHGETLQHHRSRGLVVDTVGQLEQPVGRDEPHFGIGAERGCAIGDAITWLQVGDACAHLLDDSRPLAAKAAWQLHRINTGAIIDVDEVEPDGGVADARLACPGLADIDLFPDQDFGTAGLVKADGVRHGNNSLGMGHSRALGSVSRGTSTRYIIISPWRRPRYTPGCCAKASQISKTAPETKKSPVAKQPPGIFILIDLLLRSAGCDQHFPKHAGLRQR